MPNRIDTKADNMLDDLGLNTNQYNYGMTIFYLCFLSAELPSQLISKKLGPDNWIPIQMVSWSVVAISQCKLTGDKSFYATRALMGLIEGGFIPDVILYLSYFYTSKELPIRLSYFWGAYDCTFIISAFLAFGILHLRQATGWAGWRWMFALEGGLTAIIGIVSWFYMPPSPTQTASKFRGKDGWFSEREEIIMVNRILRDDPAKVRRYGKLIKSTLLNYVIGRHAQQTRTYPNIIVASFVGLRSLAHISLRLNLDDPNDANHR
jgi:MFS family permease